MAMRHAWVRTVIVLLGLPAATHAATPGTLDAQRYGVFAEPLIAAGTPSPEAQQALAQAIVAYRHANDSGDTAALEKFLAAHPDNPWRASLWLDIGLAERTSGRFSAAIHAFEQARAAATGKTLRPIAVRALSEQLTLESRLGHPQATQDLLQVAPSLGLSARDSLAMSLAEQDLWDMQHHPQSAFQCGWMALHTLWRSLGIPVGDTPLLSMDIAHPGYTLQQLVIMGRLAHHPVEAIHQGTTAPIPVPSIAHWKSGHFATILAQEKGRYRVADPTVEGGMLWMTASAVRAESSGYFLVPRSNILLASNYRSVGVNEAQSVRGAGLTNSSDPHGFPSNCNCSGTKAAGSSGGANGASGGTAGNTPGGAPSAGNTSRGLPPATGMTSYSISPMLISLTMTDTPLTYTPPKGPVMNFTLSYNQLDSDQPTTFTYSNVGPKWTHNWLGYVQDNPAAPGSNVLVYLPTGPGRLYTGYNASNGTFAPEPETGAQLVEVSASPIVYQRRFPDGSMDVFAASDNSTSYPRHIFLTQRVDAQGNAVTLAYDAELRLSTVTDAIGQVMTFAYGNASQPLQLTSVSDAFGRTASISYDTSGRLNGITDAIGMTSNFAYDSSTNITGLTTPYGTTSFATGQSGTQRWINITDANGNTSRMEYNQNVPGVPFSDSVVPTGVATYNEYLNDRDSFYWDAQAYQQAPGDYTQALNYHWDHLTNHAGGDYPITSDAIDSIQYPLESRIWYNQPGGLAAVSGTLNVPSAIGRVLADGTTTQLTQNTYDVYGHLQSQIDPTGFTTTYTYEPNQIDVQSITRTASSGYNATESFTYDSQHDVLTHTDETGAVTQYTYTAAGQVHTVTDPLGHTTTYNYNPQGYLQSKVDANGNTTTYTYDTVGRLASETDAAGYTKSYFYDNLNRRIKTVYWDNTYEQDTYTNLDITAHRDRLGQVTQYQYDNMRNLMKVTTPNGAVTAYTYYPNNLLKTKTDPLGGVTTWKRDIEGHVTERDDPSGLATGFVYDATDRLTNKNVGINGTLGTVQAMQYAYDLNDRMTGIVDPNGVTTSLTYHVRGWPLTRTVRANANGSPSSADATTTLTYSLRGDLLTATDPDGIVVTYGYDAAQRLTSITDASGNTIQYTVDPVGNRTAENTYPSGSNTPVRSLSRHFNAVNEVSQSMDAQGRATTYGYDGDHNLTAQTDPAGILTQTNYDALDRVTSVVQNKNGADPTTSNTTTSYTYDPDSHLLSVTDPSNLATYYTPDAIGDVVKTISPDTGTTLTPYNTAGQPQSKTDANGNTVTYTYDALNRLTAEQYTDATQNISYTYDTTASGCASSYHIGRLTSVTDASGSGTTTYCYDNHGNILQKTNPDTITYTYTLGNRLSSIKYPSGNTVSYTRNAVGNILTATLTNPVYGTNLHVISNAYYLPFGPVTTYILAGQSYAQGTSSTLGQAPAINIGQNVTRSYDGNYWLTGVASPAINLSFVRNSVGDITAATDATTSPTTTESYSFDGLYRITESAITAGGTLGVTGQYTYNPTGDRMSKAGGSGLSVGTYGYTPGTHRLSTVGSGAQTSDNNGNIASSAFGGQSFGFEYDVHNRLVKVIGNGSTVATYVLDGLGQRIGKTTPSGAERFDYDEHGHLLGEYGPGSASRDYVWMGPVPVAVVTNTGAAVMHVTMGYIHADGLNTPRVVTNGAVAVIWQRSYVGDAFGETTPTSLSGYVLNLRFPGQYFDEEDGLNYNTYRDYDATTGRYIESDPTGLWGGISTYAYANGAPITYKDPYGLAGGQVSGPRVPSSASWRRPPGSGSSYGPGASSGSTNSPGYPSQTPGAWGTTSYNEYTTVCVSGYCPAQVCSANPNVPSISQIEFNGDAFTRYPTAQQFNAGYPGCTCAKWMLLDQIIPPGDPHADGDDAMDFVTKAWEARNQSKESSGEAVP